MQVFYAFARMRLVALVFFMGIALCAAERAESGQLHRGSELFISEYVEGSSYNKAIELYNPTQNTLDLSSYTLDLYSNGAATATRSLSLVGTIAPGDVYVLAHEAADAEIIVVADYLDTPSNVINFNGDDTIVLTNGGVVVDCIGQIGFDPGSEWGSGVTSTKDNTIRRWGTICVGRTDAYGVFDPSIEWEGFANNTFDGLGSHTANCGTSTNPRLVLEADADCYLAGEEVTVSLRMEEIAEVISGGQYFLSYDTSRLDFVGANPATSVYVLEIHEDVDEVAGTIDYASGVTHGGTGVSGDAELATLTFLAVDQICDESDLITWRTHNPPTRLTDNTWNAVYPTLVAMEVVDDEEPTLTMPADVVVECGDDTSSATTGVATAIDNCDGLPAITESDVVQAGSCPQESVIIRTWTATDYCGNSTSAEQTISIVDTTGPIITGVPADVTVECDSIPSAPSTLPAYDLCDSTVTEATYDGETEAAGTCAEEKTITRTWTAWDSCGNSSTVTQIVTVVDTTAPVFENSCPLPSITSYADAGDCSAVGPAASLVIPTATDNCDPAPLVAWVRSDGASNLTDPFPSGDTTITWTATDSCGNSATCEQIVTVQNLSEMLVSVELSPLMMQSVERCITFELWECDGLTNVTVEEVLSFDASGLAVAVIEVPCGVWECASAQDMLHSLRRTDESFGIVGTQYVADFTGDPNAGGDWLTGGNLNGDRCIDVLDFATYAWKYSTKYRDGVVVAGAPLNGNTGCEVAGPHADINGDGLVDTLDFSFFQVNYHDRHEVNCCGVAMDNEMDEEEPLSEISVVELRRRGLGELTVADLNNDGWLNQGDIAAFMAGVRPKPTVTDFPSRRERINVAPARQFEIGMQTAESKLSR